MQLNMASPRFNSIIIILFICTISLSIVSISCKEDLKTNQAALFAFGDSLFEAGNNNYFDSISSFRSNFWPYGKTTFKFPTGRVSDGRIMIDFIGNHQFDTWVLFCTLLLSFFLTDYNLTWQLNTHGYRWSRQIYNLVTVTVN